MASYVVTGEEDRDVTYFRYATRTRRICYLAVGCAFFGVFVDPVLILTAGSLSACVIALVRVPFTPAPEDASFKRGHGGDLGVASIGAFISFLKVWGLLLFWA